MLSRIQRTIPFLTFKHLNPFSKTPQFIKMHTPHHLLDDTPKPRKRTKTVCTIGYLISYLDPKHNIPNKLEN